MGLWLAWNMADFAALVKARALLAFNDFIAGGPSTAVLADVTAGGIQSFGWQIGANSTYINNAVGGQLEHVDEDNGILTGGAGPAAPNQNPRLWFQGYLAEGGIGTTRQIIGWISATGTATPNGAYLRSQSLGDLEFVTRQGGSETATSLGFVPSGADYEDYEIRTDDGGVTWQCYRNTQQVASHSTNVPTAATALLCVINALTTNAGVKVDTVLADCDR